MTKRMVKITMALLQWKAW